MRSIFVFIPGSQMFNSFFMNPVINLQLTYILRSRGNVRLFLSYWKVTMILFFP